MSAPRHRFGAIEAELLPGPPLMKEPAGRAQGDRPRVLLVDDEPQLLGLLTRVLAGAGYDVTACSGGRAALLALQQATFDTIISDIGMPDMGGLGLLRAVRERDADLPVILLTGGPSVESAIEAVNWGALLYLVKPLSNKALLDAVSRAVRLVALGRLKREAAAMIGVDSRVGNRAALDAVFGRALSGVVMAYQPIVRPDRSVYGHEALVRTAEPGMTRPSAFIAAAERLGELPALGRTIRAAVARTLASRRLAGPVFVNLCPSELDDDTLLDPNEPLSRFAGSVVFEITERASLDRISDLVSRITGLRAMGYRIAIDDLGAGYAGLTSFSALTPDVAKLDMGLIRGIDRDPVKQKLVTSMARLCRDLGILVVAEGIETAAECEAVTVAGCDLLQGFFLGRPRRSAGVAQVSRRVG